MVCSNLKCRSLTYPPPCVGVLAGGTSAGNVVMWKFIGGDTSLEGQDQWEYLTSSTIAAPPTQLQVTIIGTYGSPCK